MSGKNIFTVCIFTLLLGTATVVSAQQFYAETEVGSIQVSGDTGIAANFTRADGGAFPNCTNSPTQMWSDFNIVTADGGKSVLSVLLTAKASRSVVGVYYVVFDGYCRYQHVVLK